jgi:hypothetical protein
VYSSVAMILYFMSWIHNVLFGGHAIECLSISTKEMVYIYIHPWCSIADTL